MVKRYFTQTFGATAAIIEKGGKILLVKESMGVDKGKWNQPAGWLELGEDPVDSIKKEVSEETGYSFTPTNILGIYSIVKENVVGQSDEFEGVYKHTPHPIKIVFLGQISDEPVRDLHEDITEIKWFTPEEIQNMGNELRDVDIKKEVSDYFAGKKYPLELLTHTIQK